MPRASHKRLSSFSVEELQAHRDFCAQMQRQASGSRERETWKEAVQEADTELRKKQSEGTNRR